MPATRERRMASARRTKKRQGPCEGRFMTARKREWPYSLGTKETMGTVGTLQHKAERQLYVLQARRGMQKDGQREMRCRHARLAQGTL